jgi:multidrug efflux pump subunit AcrA (membrane-fusion protein)
MLFKAPRNPAPPLPQAALVTLGVIAIAAAIVGVRASPGHQGRKEEGREGLRVRAGRPGRDASACPRRQIPVSGSMKPLLQATVRSKVPAEVSRVHVQEGDRVAAGAALVSLDTADLKARYDGPGRRGRRSEGPPRPREEEPGEQQGAAREVVHLAERL